MDTFSEIGERAMKALVEAIRNELVSKKQVDVEDLGTFRVLEESTRCVQNPGETTLTPPLRQIIFKAGPTSSDSDG